VAEKAITAARARIRHTSFAATVDESLDTLVEELKTFLVGWKEYLRLAQRQRPLRDLDQWIRRRPRMAQLKQWKRGVTVYREPRARGVPKLRAQEAAAHATRWWRTAAHPALQEALPIRYCDRLGVPRLAT